MNDVSQKLTIVIAFSSNYYGEMAIRLKKRLPNVKIYTFSSKDELTFERLKKISPNFVFFPHWSHLIEQDIYEHFNCVIFHMTDVPYGRGGSPLQNLVSRGIFDTKISAIQCVKELDAGPVYLRRPLSLYGNAEEIYLRAANIIVDMVEEILRNNPSPIPQDGEVIHFWRRTQQQSNISLCTAGLENLFHHIRMLDADGYPHAFLETDLFRFEFSRASLKSGRIVADVVIKEK